MNLGPTDYRVGFSIFSRSGIFSVRDERKATRLNHPKIQLILRLFSSALQSNRIALDGGVYLREPFLKTTGYPQGENLSPVLFCSLLSNLPQKLENLHPTVGILLYVYG